MTDYKLVPLEPTPEMVSAAEEAYMPFGDMELAIRMAILAASAVQGEPVGEAGSLPGTSGFTTAVFESRKVPVGTNLYATPQPAEQNPSAGDSLTSVPDEVLAAEFAAWWDEHGQFCRAGGGTYEQSFAFEAWRHLYPQLMNLQMAAAEPDVSRLVEALVACAKASSADEVGLIVDAALSAYRKGGE